MEEEHKMSKDPFAINMSNFDRESAIRQLMSTKSGVKDLVDSGISKLPQIFKLPTNFEHGNEDQSSNTNNHYDNYLSRQVPIIDLEGHQGGSRKDIIVDDILEASRTWGIFQVINHGVPMEVINDMLESVAKFHEQPKELKEEFYSHDSTRKVWYYTTVHPVIGYAFWKDTIAWQFDDNLIAHSKALPLICRKPMLEYVKHIIQVKNKLCKLLSKGLGLDSDHLEQMECMEARKLVGHYYPVCPEPDLTMGTPKHSDPYFFTILLQNDVAGLQVLHHDKWIDVLPMEGALIAIVGDMLKLISNNKLTSAGHRVLASRKRPRLSTACFFYPSGPNEDRRYGPIKQLVSENEPPCYRETSHANYLKCFSANGCFGSKVLPLFKL